MATYVFQSQKEPEWLAARYRNSAAGLPDELAPWLPFEVNEIPVTPGSGEAKRIDRVIRTTGFYLFRRASIG